jgi:hypothetical protein|tara:strand:- start:777 stop:986 length:210 start_codon:yes stop_codon:yes gene_type:complete
MMWLDYIIDQGGNGFTVKGEWPGEVMGVGRDGKIGGDGAKSHTLYQPGDIYEVQENGWLKKISINTRDA